MVLEPSTRRRFAAFAGALAIVAFSATACTSSTSTENTTAAPATGAQITISGNKFDVPASVAPGATITVKNNDKVEHSVTADDGKTFGVDVDGNETVTLTAPSTAGSFPFHCKYHSNMVAVLVVT
ncbi:cupredoxin domain-containing protein [Nocardia sp. NPDC051030]|uniref:cupredoxin domain-containing protein n=1 Tax=Nocardia sp. NPDC051030 TaxID=3155162 RepID=UPI0034436D77